MCANAGTKPEAKALTTTNVYAEIITANKVLDDAEVPETGRVLVVTQETNQLMKQCRDIVMETDIGADMRMQLLRMRITLNIYHIGIMSKIRFFALI